MKPSSTLQSSQTKQFRNTSYNFVTVDHSSYKNAAVCLYYKHSLPLKFVNVSYIQECINFAVKTWLQNINLFLGRKKNELENVTTDFEFNVKRIVNKSSFLIAVLGDFNATLKGWNKNNITIFEGCKVDTATFQFGLRKMIKQP